MCRRPSPQTRLCTHQLRIGTGAIQVLVTFEVTSLDQTTKDKLAGYNRPEHLRGFPETDPLYIDVQKPLRASAESAKRYLDDHHPRERLHHYGFQRNTLSMLAWQAYRNAQTEHVFSNRSTVEPQHLKQTG